ncbi:sodium:solute symporter family protein [Halosquirtibacter laminarini]|uniref:Sodium:solute symporter family protein n=1 Tax=Halosquirtibacter laminarini TaxID=3374600 RepID=A0AC61NPE9_9BACT|nr:sodium:solute symporter family protein [Prolixibacteraceae bacterium]
MIQSSTLSLYFLAFYILIIIWVGIKNRNSDDSESYFLASRQLPSWSLAITFIASWWGGGSAIDLVDHAHGNGINSFWIYGVPVLISTFLLFLFSKAIRQIGTISQPQLIEKRYNRSVSLLLTIFIIVFMVITAAVQVIVIGRFFHSFFGVSYEVGATVGTLVVVCYSFFGGFKGVVLTDLIQFVFFLITAVVLFYISYERSGGYDEVVAYAESHGKEGYCDFFYGVSDQLAYVITFGASWMIQANVWQRVSAAKDGRSAKRMMLISFFVFIPLYLMVTFTGMFSSVFYQNVPKGGIVPDMVLNMENPFFSAILFVGLCSAIMSTMDSLVNTGAMSLTLDIYGNYVSPNASPRRLVWVGRLSTLIVAIVSLFIALRVQSVLTISWIGSDFLTTGAFVPVVLGFVWSKGSSRAAWLSMVFGLLFSSYNLLVAMGFPLPVCWEVASVKQALIGIGFSLLIYGLGSFLWPDKNNKGEAFISMIRD